MFRPRSIGLLLALATLLIYLPATSCQFINFDDQDYVTDNHVVQNGLTWAGVKWAFMGSHAANWHPLTWLSHMADCDLFRLNPAGPHLVNILFHAMNVALLFALVFRLTKKMWPAAFIAALFAWHPLHVESVAWVSERKDVLSTFFALLTLLSYTRYAHKNSGANSRESVAGIASPAFDYSLAGFFFVLALLSKPMPVTLPVVMLLLDYWPLNRVQGHKLKAAGSASGELSTFNFQLSIIWEKWPFFLLSALSCILTILAQQKTVSTLASIPLYFRLENTLTAYAGYLWKMVWPFDLAIFYPLHSPIALPLIAEAAVLLAGISLIVWRERKSSPWLIVGWLWFLVTLLPVIGLVQVGRQAMADRYSYFPLIGIFLAITFSADGLVARFSFLKKWIISSAILILGICLVLSEKQLSYWRDSESLFTHALAVADSDVAHFCLGLTLQDQNRPTEAMNQYLRTLELDPGSDLAYDNIAKLLDDEGKIDFAARYCQEAVRRKPQSVFAHINFGIMLGKLHRYDEAIHELSVAAQLDASDVRPQFFMGQFLLKQGKNVEAMQHLKAALQIDPDDVQALIFTASVMASEKDQGIRNGASALTLAGRAVKLTGGRQPAALDVQAMACAEMGQYNEAVQIEEEAIKISQAANQGDNLDVLKQRLKRYQSHQPWRESFKEN